MIFSRKGFDSQYGRVASPILPDGRMISLPIPSSGDVQRLGMLRVEGIDISALAADLTGNRINAQTSVHLDPDLSPPASAGSTGWRPAFGQIAQAQSHLHKQGVGPGDLFLFFGWFRQVEQVDSRWRYVPESPDLHVLFGWLQVSEVLKVTGQAPSVVHQYPWLSDHPHITAAGRFTSTNNTIYLAKSSLHLGGLDTELPGGGIFEHFNPSLQMTTSGRTRTCWRLPGWFMPSDGRPALTYHSNPVRWTADGDTVLLQTVVAKGQEFVLDCAAYPEAIGWFEHLFSAAIPQQTRGQL